MSIIPFADAHAQAFYDINAAWISDMFVLELRDEYVLRNPRATILDPGGAILMVQNADGAIIGAGALLHSGDGAFELTKMGVTAAARGLKAGEVLLLALIAEAHRRNAMRLYLLTNRICYAAIHLYEKAGFVHDADIMARYGGTYARCDVAMSFPIESYPISGAASG